MKKVRIIILALFIILVVILGTLYLTNANNSKNEKKAEKATKTTEIKEEKDNSQTEEVEEEGTNNYVFTDDEGNDVEIKADKVVTATGFAGSSNYQFYLIGTDLYFENISITDSKEKIAEGIEDVYLKGEYVTAVLGENGKILKENNYITYE